MALEQTPTIARSKKIKLKRSPSQSVARSLFLQHTARASIVSALQNDNILARCKDRVCWILCWVPDCLVALVNMIVALAGALWQSVSYLAKHSFALPSCQNVTGASFGWQELLISS